MAIAALLPLAALFTAATAGEANPITLNTTTRVSTPAALRPGQRAFELMLARHDASAYVAIVDDEEPDDLSTVWFECYSW